MRKLDVRLCSEELARRENGNGVTPASAAQLVGRDEAQSQMVSERAWQDEQVGVPSGVAWNRASAEVSELLGEAERIWADEAAGRAKPEVDRDTGLRAVWTEVRIDPVSGREVANPDAGLSAMRSGVRVYFESEDNWRAFEARYGAEEQSKCTAENSSSRVR